MTIFKRKWFSLVYIGWRDGPFLPFTDVEDPWTFEEQDLKSILDAVIADVLKGPVPIVVVEITEVLSTSVDLGPKVSIERHAHVVLRAHPLGQLNLEQQNGF